MKILSLDLNNFFKKDINIFGVDCYLIYPREFSIEWDNLNSVFRSSIWRKSDNSPLSLSWKKFVNIGEQPNFEPIDFNKKIEYIQKIDGSCAILSKINKNICFRTRQTFDARNLHNGHEVDLLINKYPKLFNNGYINSEQYTILCEWTTPSNIICLKESSEPKLWLTGIVRHEDYSYISQSDLDILSLDWEIDRPIRYEFDSSDSALEFSKNHNEIEGLILYCNDGQVLKKCKSLRYLNLHRFKSQCTLNNLLDLFFQYDCPDFLSFLDKIEKDFDFECMTQAKDLCIKIYNTYLSVLDNIYNFKQIVEQNKDLTIKDYALKILADYKDNSSYLFTLRKLGELNKGQIRKLMEREIERE